MDTIRHSIHTSFRVLDPQMMLHLLNPSLKPQCLWAQHFALCLQIADLEMQPFVFLFLDQRVPLQVISDSIQSKVMIWAKFVSILTSALHCWLSSWHPRSSSPRLTWESPSQIWLLTLAVCGTSTPEGVLEFIPTSLSKHSQYGHLDLGSFLVLPPCCWDEFSLRRHLLLQ